MLENKVGLGALAVGAGSFGLMRGIDRATGGRISLVFTDALETCGGAFFNCNSGAHCLIL